MPQIPTIAGSNHLTTQIEQVVYTPAEVVRYMVARVDKTLINDLDTTCSSSWASQPSVRGSGGLCSAGGDRVRTGDGFGQWISTQGVNIFPVYASSVTVVSAR